MIHSKFLKTIFLSAILLFASGATLSGPTFIHVPNYNSRPECNAPFVITGVVSDELGAPIFSVEIFFEGQTVATTDLAGKFSFPVARPAKYLSGKKLRMYKAGFVAPESSPIREEELARSECQTKEIARNAVLRKNN